MNKMTDVRKLRDNLLYEIDGEVYSVVELKGFIESSKKLSYTKERQTRFIKALKLNNSALTLERNQLQEKVDKLSKELQDIKELSMFEFANKYCSESDHEAAGHLLARSLLGHRMTDEEVKIEEAEDNYVPYTAEDF